METKKTTKPNPSELDPHRRLVFGLQPTRGSRRAISTFL
jgi:hypothetical protein